MQVTRAELENCYLRVPHCIKGTIPTYIMQRLQKFYQETFWGNLEVFRCNQAAQALCRRGLNVVRLFIGLSSGGVGQSLYSAHLQSMYAHNFAYFAIFRETRTKCGSRWNNSTDAAVRLQRRDQARLQRDLAPSTGLAGQSEV